MIPFFLLPRKAKQIHVDAGEGVAVRKISGRNLLSIRRRPRELFEGSWWVTLNDGKVAVGRGYVNGMEPTIGGVPIGGVMPDGTSVAQPLINHSGGVAYVCLRITPDAATGKIQAESDPRLTSDVTVEIGGAAGQGRAAGASWFYPLAIISEFGKIAQLAYFDISYKAYKKRGEEEWLHRLGLEALTWRNLEEIIAEDKAIRKTLAA